MATHIINGVKIRTDHVYPPIPVRDFDWQAMRDDDEPSDGETRDPPCGHGATEQEAIQDLIDQLEEA